MSSASVESVAQLLRKQGIVCDGICISDDASKSLRSLTQGIYHRGFGVCLLMFLTKGTGGCCFSPNSAADQIKIGELEVFVRLTERAYEIPSTWSFLSGSRAPFDVAEGDDKPKRAGVEFAVPSSKVKCV